MSGRWDVRSAADRRIESVDKKQEKEMKFYYGGGEKGMKKSIKKAFTMIEMMVVVAIIGVLGSVLLPNVTRMLDRARKSGTQEIVNSTLTGLMGYYEDQGDYPNVNYYNSTNNLRVYLQDYASYTNYDTFLQDGWKHWMSYHRPDCYGYVGAIYSNGSNGANNTWSCWWWRYRGFNSDDIGRVLKK